METRRYLLATRHAPVDSVDPAREGAGKQTVAYQRDEAK